MKAKIICEKLGGRWYGSYGLAFCPAHENTTSPALSLTTGENGTLLAKCFAGCSFKDILTALRSGAMPDTTIEKTGLSFNHPGNLQLTQKNSQRAREIWEASRSVTGTFAQTYLAGRGIQICLPSSLRFHPALYHGPSRQRLPALVARIEGSGAFAIHRTFLAPDGQRKVSVEPTKMMLGHARGGAVRLGQSDGKLLVGEGIETCLSVVQETGIPAWAALSSSGMRALDLPDRIRDVILLADGDEAGEAAAHNCAHRWARPDRRIRIARPPRGLDFNDLLLQGSNLLGEA